MSTKEAEEQGALGWEPYKGIKDRNARRRARYANDPAYRQSVLSTERKKRTNDAPDCRANIDRLGKDGPDGIGVRRTYTNDPDGKDGWSAQPTLTFTIEEAAKALERTPKSLYKYYSKGLFPRPEHYSKGPTGLLQEVYLGSEMRALINVFGRHLAETPYYGTYHDETRKALFRCVGAK